MLFLKSVMWYLKNRMRKQFFFYEDPNHTVAENILGRSLLLEELWHSQQQLQNHSANFLLQPDGEPWLSLAPGPALSGSAKAAWITQVKSLDSVSHFFVFSYICCFSLDVSKVLSPMYSEKSQCSKLCRQWYQSTSILLQKCPGCTKLPTQGSWITYRKLQ